MMLKLSRFIRRAIFEAPRGPKLFPLSFNVARRRERGEDKYSTMCDTAVRVRPIADSWRLDK